MEVGSAATAGRYRGCGEVVVGLARENRRSCRCRSTRAAGARRCASTRRAIVRRACRAGASAEHRSLACCSGRWKCGAKRPPPAATRATISALQSIGSSELILNVTSPETSRAPAEARAASVDGRQVAAVRAQMNPGQRDFLEACGGHARDLAEHPLDRQAAAGAARRRDDAVAAPLFAAGLHPQRERRPACDAGSIGKPQAPCASAKPSPWARRRSGTNPRRSGLSSFPTTRTTPGAPRLRPPASGVTTRGDDLRRRVLARDAPNRLPCSLIGGRRHRTVLTTTRSASRRRDRVRHRGAQIFLDPQRVRLIHTAAECHDRVPHSSHESCHDGHDETMDTMKTHRQSFIVVIVPVHAIV